MWSNFLKSRVSTLYLLSIFSVTNYHKLNTHLLLHSFYGSGIWEGLAPPSALGSQTGCSQGIIQGGVLPEAWTGEGSASEHILVWQDAFPGGLRH